MKVASHYFFEYFIPIFLLCVDISLFGFLHQPIIFAVLCWYIIQLNNTSNTTQLYWILSVLAVQSTLFYGRFGLELIYLIPVTIIVIKLRPYIGWQFLLLAITLIISLLLQTYLVQNYLLALPVTSTYTVTKIIGNLTVIGLVSLKQYLIR
jgi:hypothetical protein